MKIQYSMKRIGAFFLHHCDELYTKELWMTVLRVVKNRFNYWEKISKSEYEKNLRSIRQRPWNLHLELTNLCNANCIFCAYQYQKRPITFMTDDIYKKAVDDYCNIGGGDLMLEVVVGDPAVDPKFIERIKQARARKEIASIQTSTNAIALKENQIQDLINSGINKIQISTAPLNEELYSRLFRSKAYKIVLRNMTLLLKTNQDSGCPVDIKIAFRSNLKMKDTVQQPDYLKISHYPHSIEFNADFDTWTGEITADQLLDGMYLRGGCKIEYEPCIWLYDGPIIYANGNVGLCGCRDYNADSELIVGNISENSLIKIWQSDKVETLRKRFITGDLPDICKKCTTYSNLDLLRTKTGKNRAILTEERLNNSNYNKTIVERINDVGLG